MEIIGKGFRLRPWEIKDVPALAHHANNPNVSATLRDRFPYPYTEADARAFITSNLREDRDRHFAIEIEGEAAGAIGLIFAQDVYRLGAEIGYWLAEPYWGRSIVTNATCLLAQYAFLHTELVRIYATVFETNPASRRVLEKAGFQLEGILRKSVIKNDVVMDGYLYALIKP